MPLAGTRVVLWTEGETGPRFGLDQVKITRAGGLIRNVACRDEADRVAAAADAYMLVVSQAQIGEAIFAGCPGLVGVVRTGIGLDTVDLPAATRHGVCIAHVPDFCYDEVADTTMTLLLSVARKVRLADRHVRGGSWSPSALLPMPRLRGKTMGLVAFGHIARMVAERARAFGLQVIAFDPYVEAPAMAKLGVEKVETLEALLGRSDIVSLHTPLTDETRGLIGRAAFAAMKPGAILINTSRGKVVDEAALIEALRSGRLAGGGLDVLWMEPPAQDNPLLAMDNVVLTPHYASSTVEAIEDLIEKVNRQIVQFLRGEWPTYLANRTVREQPGCRLAAAGAAR
jgi:D-3-phosphoglycerate dehydrogenase / 2-oxoglutarate reductase